MKRNACTKPHVGGAPYRKNVQISGENQNMSCLNKLSNQGHWAYLVRHAGSWLRDNILSFLGIMGISPVDFGWPSLGWWVCDNPYGGWRLGDHHGDVCDHPGHLNGHCKKDRWPSWGRWGTILGNTGYHPWEDEWPSWVWCIRTTSQTGTHLKMYI